MRQITRSLSSAFDDKNTAATEQPSLEATPEAAPVQHSIEAVAAQASIEAAAAQPSSGLLRRVSVDPNEDTPEKSPSANAQNADDARLLSDIKSKVRLYLLVSLP